MQAYRLELPMDIYQELEAAAQAEHTSPATLIQQLLTEERQRKAKDQIQMNWRSVVDILGDSPGQRIFKTTFDVDLFLAEERALWDN